MEKEPQSFKAPRLLAAAKEFNIGQDTLVNFLASKGFSRDELKPTAKLSEAMYRALKDGFDNDKISRNKANLIEIPKSAVERRSRIDEKDISILRVFSNVTTRKIHECIENKSSILDLGRLGLTDENFETGSEVEKLLKQCRDIKILIFSNNWINPFTQDIEYSENHGKDNRLYKLPEVILHLSQLEIIVFSGSQEKKWGIRNLKFIEKLQNLHQLDLSHNVIKEFISVRHQNIKTLSLKGNKIEKIGDDNEMESLQVLDISSNDLKTVQGINRFKSLTSLNICNNQLNDTKGLYGLPNLKTLLLANNNLPTIEGLNISRSLEALDLARNQILKIEGLGTLTNLKFLSLDNNIITEISGLNSLKNLRMLSINYNFLTAIGNGLEALNLLETFSADCNKIVTLNGIEHLTSALELYLNDNKIESVEPLLKLENLKSVSLIKNPVLDVIPDDIVSVGWKAIKDFISGGERIVFKEVKVLLLGNPNVGKSNLLEYLETGKKPTKEEPTHGIQYKKFDKFYKDINIHCWDFGGQEYFHATHQLFFSPGALHIILWSFKDIPRDEKNAEECFALPYWIRCIEQLMPYDAKENIEVVIVENKIDVRNNKIDPINQKDYSDKYPNINFNFTNLSLKNLSRVNSFKEILEERLETLCNEYLSSYHRYLKKIQKSEEAFISVESIDGKHIEDVKTAMTVFHNMGILLYFKDIIPNKVFIHPQALLDLLYKDILNKEKSSCISRSNIEKAIKNNILELSTEEVIELLRYFDLVFQIQEKSELYFVPQYLKTEPIVINFFEQHQFQKPNIIIESDRFLMNLAMLKIFGEYGKYVKGEENKEEYLFWKDGIIIDKNSMILMIKFDRNHQRIKLYPDIKGNNFSLQKEIVSYILTACSRDAKRLKDITKENDNTKDDIDWRNENFIIHVSIDGLYFADWNKLIENRRSGIHQISVVSKTDSNEGNSSDRKSKVISIFDYNHYLPLDKKGKMKKIFISYSKDDIRLVNKFLDHLSALKLDGKIATWYCSELTAGSEWNSEIQEHFDNADIACFMVSPNFMRTKYIQEYEVKKAFEKRNENPDFKIVPIILRYCGWRTEKNNLGDFTALPYTAKPVTDFNDEDTAWYIVEQCLRVIINEDINLTNNSLYSNPSLPEDVKRIFERIKEGRIDNNVY